MTPERLAELEAAFATGVLRGPEIPAAAAELVKSLRASWAEFDRWATCHNEHVGRAMGAEEREGDALAWARRWKALAKEERWSAKFATGLALKAGGSLHTMGGEIDRLRAEVERLRGGASPLAVELAPAGGVGHGAG